VTSENIFPVIKKFLYSEQEIFLRELVSNAVDATTKAKALARKGDLKEELGDLTVRVKVDKEAKTITVSDHGIGMTAEEVDKYINQIAFSSAGDFLEKYKDSIDAIIGHYGLGFYSAFMVSEKVEIITKSWQPDTKAVKWTCDGSPEYTMEDADRTERGTDIILHIDADSTEYLEDSRIETLLKKYCMFLPVAIGFGKEKEWKDDKYVETGKDKIVNDTEPLWLKKPADLKDEDYKAFYKKLYPGTYEDPLFNIHLNVDYPFNLTGILYFPKIRTNLEVQKNKIQLYCNQVFVTDSVEGIVPEFLTLLHGVLDSPDIPLNVSRSYLQSDSNVKKISNHITKKVSDKLTDLFKNHRDDFEKKWDDLKLFIQYGMLTNDKFYESAKDFFLYKNTEGKYFTFDEYKNIIKDNQTDKNKTVIALYATDKEEQYSFVSAAKEKGYDVLVMDSAFDAHFINQIEQKNQDIRFMRVDSDTLDKLIRKDDNPVSQLSDDEKKDYSAMFDSQTPKDSKKNFTVEFDTLSADDMPVIITQSEFMRRMKDMGKLGGPESNFYNNLPDNLNLVVNEAHPLVKQLIADAKAATADEVSGLEKELSPLKSDLESLEKLTKDKKDEEISTEEKDKKSELQKKISDIETRRKALFENFAAGNKLVKQLIDLALLANNMLRGEDLTKFVKRSVELIEK
ncbi:MAG: molecular chaperone HtpG, partial [Bacteroidales bacterium]|nr:molecular chaperone HtpG [Bacteroidales bacterium]